MTVNVDTLSADKETSGGNRNMILRFGTENSKYGASKKREILKENGYKKKTYTQNEKQTTEMS